MKESGNPPDNEILQQILKTNVEFIEKINATSRELVHVKKISRLIHFPKDKLKMNHNLRDNFLAGIILHSPRKLRKS